MVFFQDIWKILSQKVKKFENALTAGDLKIDLFWSEGGNDHQFFQLKQS